jgi:5-methylcytosine-specific restriction protein B
MWQIERGTQEQEDFLKEWPIQRIENISLDEYSNSDRDSGFIYWLEKRTEHTGSIWGGSAFKFGIYRRKNLETFHEKKMVKTDGVYAWLSKYGSTREEAFKNVKNIVLRIASASISKNFNEIDSIDLGDSVKWKIAFLYNPNNLIPIFNSKVLLRAAESTGLRELDKDNISVIQKHLVNIKPSDLKTLQFANQLWEKYNLDTFYPTIEKFIEQAQTDNQKRKGYPTSYRNLSVKVSFGFGILATIPWLAFLKEPNTVSSGIYPVYLYFKSYNVLILAYGVSATNVPSFNWPNEEQMQTVEEWFLENRKIKPEKYGSSYIKAVYDLNEDLDPEKLQSDLDTIIDQYNRIDFDIPTQAEESNQGYSTKRIWLIAAGEGGFLWDEFIAEGIIAVSWDDMGDLLRFSSREAIRDQLNLLYPDGSKSQVNNSLCLWEFSREMKAGDIVIAKKGQSEYLGYGIISTPYYFDDSRDQYKHLRNVEWKKKGNWEESVHQIVTKTLTDITKYPEYVDRLKRLIGIEQEATVDANKIEYYWLNANPKYWKIEDFEIGQEQTYTTLNEKGNKRIRAEYFQKIKPGDLVIGYETTPIQKVVAIFEITQGAHFDDDTGKEEITFKIQKFLPNPISLEVLKAMPELINSEVMKNNQGSLFRLTKEEYLAIIEKDITLETSFCPYTRQDAQKEVFLDAEELENILNCLEYKRNIILQGPPGVGKTYMAKRLAFLIMEEKDLSKIEMIQFHQSYSYEDFVQGIRPKEDGTFKLENGIFFRFCKRAQADPGNKYFFIIDEINRGNLSKIFGELMLLMEVDKRGEENAVPLTYSAANENKFYIPSNVYFIGTMNTADRSLALVDYALRRRFAFINLTPKFNTRFREELTKLNVDEALITPLIEKISSLNNEIEMDTNLGQGFRIGHSYFCNVPQNSGDEDWYNNIIKNEIAPLLEEYWFDNDDKAKLEINRLYLR